MTALFRLLVRLFPPAFRIQFGADLLEQLSAEGLRARARGRWSAVVFSVATAVDLTRSAVAERISPSWRPNRRTHWVTPSSAFEVIRRSIRFGARALMRAPSFTVMTVLLIGLGVGAVTTVFTLVDHLFLRPLPYPSAERLLRVNSSQSHPSLRDLQAMRSVEAWAAAAGEDVNLTGDGSPVQLREARVTEGFFTFFGAGASLGRVLSAGDFSSDDVVVLSHEAWRRVWGEDPGVVGRTLRIDGAPVRVAGVLDRSFVAPEALLDGAADIWRPVDPNHPDFASRDWHVLVTAGRLARGATLEQARAEAAKVAASRASAFPGSYVRSDGSIVELPIDDLREATVGSARDGLGLLLAAVTLLLLIASANVAHLFMARGLGRSSELAVRRALGGGTGTIAGQLLAESVLVAAAGTVVGVALASFGLHAFTRLAPDAFPRAGELSLDARIVAFAAGASTAVAILFGLLPMFRVCGRQPIDGLRSGARGLTHDRVTPSLRAALVVAEVALSVILVSSAGLLVGNFVRLREQPLGFRTANIWTIPLRIGDDDGVEERRARLERVADALRRTAGVGAVTYGLSAPLEHNGGSCCWSRLARRSASDPGVDARAHPFGGDYFDVFAPRLVAGRAWTAAELDREPAPAVLNDVLATELFGSVTAAVGREILLRGAPHQVVGVVPEDRHYGVLQEHGPAVYVPISSLTFVNEEVTVAVRIDDAAGDVPTRLRDAIWTVEPDLALPIVRPMDEWAERATARPRFDAWLATAFGAVALALAAAGLYGTLVYAIASERRGLAIRLSLGARARDLESLVLRRGLTAAGLGIALGLAGYWATARVAANRILGFESAGLSTVLVVAGGLLVTTALACWIPARRAGALDPLEILREQ